MKSSDFKRAVTYHLGWKTRLRDFLDGKEAITEAEALSPEECELGKWLYAEGLDRFAALPEIRELEEVHRSLHEALQEVLAKKYGGDGAGAEQALQRLEALSERIFSLLQHAGDL